MLFKRKGELDKGSMGHEQLEMYLIHGVVPEWEFAAALIPHLPNPPQPRECVEWFWQVYDGQSLEPTMTGKIDFLQFLPSGNYVTDFKFTSSFRWALTEDELRVNPQAVVYAVVGAHLHPMGNPDLPTRVRFLYGKKSGAPDSFSVVVQFDPGEALGYYKRYLEPEEQAIDALARFSRPEDTPYNESGCSQYRGCGYRDLCLEWGVDSYGEMSGVYRSQRKGTG